MMIYDDYDGDYIYIYIYKINLNRESEILGFLMIRLSETLVEDFRLAI